MNVKGLCEVILEDNKLDDEACKDIANFLRFDTWMRAINLKNNKIGREGIIEFIRVLSHNTSLLSLDLRDNEGFNRKASEIILECLRKNMKLFKEQFNLKDEIGNENLETSETENLKTENSNFGNSKVVVGYDNETGYE